MSRRRLPRTHGLGSQPAQDTVWVLGAVAWEAQEAFGLFSVTAPSVERC